MTGTLKVTKIKFHTGASPGKLPLEIEPGTVVIFVGPNNSGKSLALREIEGWCFGQDTPRKVVDAVEVDFPGDPSDAERILRQFEAVPDPKQVLQPGNILVGQHMFRGQGGADTSYVQVNLDSFKQCVTSNNTSELRRVLSTFATVRLDGRTRFMLVDQKPAGDLLGRPQNHLWALFKDDASRQRVRELTSDAFGLHFVVDPLGMQHFRIRMSQRPPSTTAEEQALDEVAREFHSQAPLINEFSDGIQAFTGLIAAIQSLPHKIMLIDEPGAFLHPTLIRRLGGNLAGIARDREASLLAATHDSEFLMGCLEKIDDVTVVRLTYDRSVATARALEPGDLKAMMRDPLLRSTNVLSALFCKAAVVTEADTDRAFYDEMNRRLVNEDKGMRDTVFLNAQNWQTVCRLVGPLRKIGIPAIAIVDVDVLTHTGTNWRNLMASCQIPESKQKHLESERNAVTNGLDGKVLKAQGILSLGPDGKTRADALLRELADYGIFIVPVGELENWLKHLGVEGHGPDWLVNIFSRIGQSETDPNYLKPANDDIWNFLENMASWINNPNRLGTD